MGKTIRGPPGRYMAAMGGDEAALTSVNVAFFVFDGDHLGVKKWPWKVARPVFCAVQEIKFIQSERFGS